MSFTFNDKLFDQIEESAKRGVSESADIVKEEIGDLIFGSKNGRTYIRGSKVLDSGQAAQFTFDTGKRTHKASAPGEPFANDYGAWWGSLVKEMSQEGHIVSAELITGVEYAAALELGSSKMAARPTMRPALANKQEAVVQEIHNRIAKVIK